MFSDNWWRTYISITMDFWFYRPCNFYIMNKELLLARKTIKLLKSVRFHKGNFYEINDILNSVMVGGIGLSQEQKHLFYAEILNMKMRDKK